MPVKNASQWLEEGFDSMINQSYTHWELIAINDHSIDNSDKIIEEFSSKDKRIRLYDNTGTGIVDALNTALSHARGKWISRMDADDIMPKDKLEVLVATLDWNEKAVATGKVNYFSEHPISKGYLEYEAWLNDRIDCNDHWNWIYRECVIASANWLTHISNMHFEEDIYPEDYALTFHWFKKGLTILGSKNVTHKWREHPDRTSRNSDHYEQTSFFNLKIGQFLKLSRDPSRPLVVMGNNQKSRITMELLNNNGVDVHHIHAENIEQFQRIETPQVLVAIFPKSNEKQLIEELMMKKNLMMGQHWWWL